MSLLTEQEIRSIMRSVKEIGENSDRALILATEYTVIEKIKEQGPGGYYYQDTDTAISHNQYLQLIAEHEGNSEALRELGTLLKLYHIPEGD